VGFRRASGRAAGEEGRVSEQTSEQADERADKQASGEQAAGERLASMQVERCVSSAHAKAPAASARAAVGEKEAREAAVWSRWWVRRRKG
jgi:hypothetical protein